VVAHLFRARSAASCKPMLERCRVRPCRWKSWLRWPARHYPVICVHSAWSSGYWRGRDTRRRRPAVRQLSQLPPKSCQTSEQFLGHFRGHCAAPFQANDSVPLHFIRPVPECWRLLPSLGNALQASSISVTALPSKTVSYGGPMDST
jgi:hypothetical protein